MRNDLNRGAKIIATPFPIQDSTVHLARCGIIIRAHIHINESFVVA